MTIDNDKQNRPGPRRLYRNMADKQLGGVCSGLAGYFQLETSLVRIAALITLLFGFGFFAYIILWIVIPKAHLNADGTVNHF